MVDRLPLVLASNIPIWLTVPQVDVHCGNSTATEFVDTQLKPAELQASLAASASKYLSDSNDPTAEFERRIKVANLALKEKDIDTKKEIANLPFAFGEESQKIRFSDVPPALRDLMEDMITRVEDKIGTLV